MGNKAAEAPGSLCEAGRAWPGGREVEGRERKGRGGCASGLHPPRPIEKEPYISNRSGNECIGSELPRCGVGLGLTESRFPAAWPEFPRQEQRQKPPGRRAGRGRSRREQGGRVRVCGTGPGGRRLGFEQAFWRSNALVFARTLCNLPRHNNFFLRVGNSGHSITRNRVSDSVEGGFKCNTLHTIPSYNK